MAIHPTAIISPKAHVPSDIEIGPYCVIGDDVTLDTGCQLFHHVSLTGPSKFGKDNVFYPFCVIGQKTQDLKYTKEPTHLTVGDKNEFREFVTVNRATAPGETTVIGSNNHFLAYSHIAHNCAIGNFCVLSNNGTLGGHVIVGDHVVVGGFAAVHQYCRLGAHAMIGGCSKIVQDVPPYFIADGNPAEVCGVNVVGLQRRDFLEDQIKVLRRAFKMLYDKRLNTSQAVEKIKQEITDSIEVKNLIQFIESTQRGIIR